MKESGRLESALEILAALEDSKSPLDTICHGYFKSRRYIGSKDRKSITDYVYAVIRHRALCDWWALERGVSPLLMGPQASARIRLLAYLWVCEKVSRAQLGILFSGEKYAPSKITNSESYLFAPLPKLEKLPPWVEGEFPEWMYPLLKNRFGETLKEEMKALQNTAPLDLRVNTLKASREDMLKELAKKGWQPKATPFSPWGIRCEGHPNVAQTKAFQKGLLEVQDEGSQLIVHVMDDLPGQTILDMCAGAGGKTLALAATLKNKGKIVAADIADWRLKRTKERLKRAGVYNVELRHLSESQDKWLKRQKERFDGVLVDAPCSGTGTWRRNPDQKWNLKKQDIAELAALQSKLLDAAAVLLKPGGVLVYATCSFLCEENEDISEKFLKTHPDFSLVPCGLEGESYLSLSPFRTGTDGFFAAKFMRGKQ